MSHDLHLVLVVSGRATSADLLVGATNNGTDSLRIRHCADLFAARGALVEERPDVLLLDLSLADRPADLRGEADALAPDVPVVLLCPAAREEEALRLVRQGASDYVVEEDADPRRLLRALRAAVQRARFHQDELVALRHSEALFSGIVSLATEAIISMDEAQRIVLFNRGAEETFGYRAEEIVGQPIELLIPRRFWHPHRLRVAEFEGSPVAARHMGERQEIHGVRRSGEEFPAEATISKLDLGTERLMTVVLRDVTERKEAERELAAAVDHYRRLVVTSPYAIFAFGLDGRFTEVNPATAELLGRPAHELLGRHMAEVLAPEDYAHTEARWRERLAGKERTEEHETRIVRPSGERRLIRVRSTAIHEDGVVAGTHGIAHDITEERARQEEMQLLAAALEGLDHGVTISRLDGQVIYANAAHARMIGYDRGRSPLPAMRAFIPEAEARRIEEILASLPERGTWAGRSERRRIDTGEAFPVWVSKGRVDRSDGERLLFSIVRDISEELRREKHLRRAERLASVGTLIGGVAHELNNPLHAIRNFAELMLMDERNDDDREALEIVRREADRAAKVVADLRQVARQTQNSEGAREAVDLNDVVRYIVRIRRYVLDTRNVQIQEELADDLPRVLAHRGELEQVVLNLVVNAEQAMAGWEGEQRLILRTRASASGVRLDVVDTGPGIAPWHLEQIFDPFFTTKPPGEGTGLGLSLVHSILSEHGGQIHVESEPGRGAAFRIDLTRAHEAGLPVAEEPAPAAPRRALRVLVVDDEEAIRYVEVRGLTRLGHSVDVAAEGAEALRLLERAEYDVILSDLRMPGLDGEELLRRLRARGQGWERRLILVTGDPAGAQAARAACEIDVPVLVKPVRFEELARAVERVANP